MNNNANNRCQHCRWYEQCKELTDLVTEGCDDYDPMDDSLVVSAYEEDLKDRDDLYWDYVKEYNDLIYRSAKD